MELRHLRYFLVVSEELHYARAAARLRMEPQPLHFQVKQLERELGFSLFQRKENRTHLTAAGAALATETRNLLEAVDSAIESARRASQGESGLLRLACTSPALYEELLPAIRGFRERYRAVYFEFASVATEDQAGALHQGRLDVGISLLPVDGTGLETKVLVRAPPVLVVSANDPLAKQTAIEWRQLQGLQQIVLRSATRFTDRIRVMLAQREMDVRVARAARDGDALLATVGVGPEVAFVPLESRTHSKDVRFLRLPDDAPRFEYGLVWLGSDHNRLRDKFLDHLSLQHGKEFVR